MFNIGSTPGKDPRPINTNPTFKNNILTAPSGGGAVNSPGYWDGKYSNLIMSHNNFYGHTSGVPAQTNPINGNPLFVNPASDWHLQTGSPAINSGYGYIFPRLRRRHD